MDFVRFNDPSHPALMKYASDINNEAEIARIPPCLLAAIVNRETGGQNEYQIGMPKGPGCGVGLTQITASVNWSNPEKPTFAGYDLMNPADNLYVSAAYFLSPAISEALRLQRDNPKGFAVAANGQVIYGAAVEYNAGQGALMAAVGGGYNADGSTTNAYAADVFSHYSDFVAASHAAGE